MRKQLRLAFLSSGLYKGGFTSSLLSMTRKLRNEGNLTDFIFLCENTNNFISDYQAELDNSKVIFYKQKRSTNASVYYNILQMNPSCIKYRISKNPHLRLWTIYHGVKSFYSPLDLSEYDAVISWEEGRCNEFLAEKTRAKLKIGYIHPDYLKANLDPSLDRRILAKLDFIIGVAQTNTKNIKKLFPQLKDRIKYIPNAIDETTIIQKSKLEGVTFDKSLFDIVTVCRLDIKTKGLDRLLRVAKKLNDEHLQYQWYIIGEGEGKHELEAAILKLSLTNVHLMGGKDNPYPYMKRADLFALLSTYEGRPVVVDEAIALQIPVLVTSYESAQEQVDDDKGWIVEMDDNMVFNRISQLIRNKEILKDKYSNAGTACNSKGTDLLSSIIRKHNS